ncbi:RNA-directed RNA polymerase [Lyophyllum atratum]|nr:RNA-directed RNA polymerase [Lyophyllum atratum]
MVPHVLRDNPSKADDNWRFTVPSGVLKVPSNRPNHGKLISFSSDKITLQITKFPENRVLRSDDPSKFILLSFGNLRFPESTIREGSEYIMRLFKAGLFLNGVQYRFYHHSNSQLRGRSCFVREANSDAELDARIYALGDYGKIMNIAKRAKRIGLLFSEAQLDWQLDPGFTTDIPDIRSGDEIFSDGCGLMSRHFAVQLSRARKIIIRGARYTPTVFQIRYLGYKGVLMLHPDLDVQKKHLVQFRKSMRKFSTTADLTFSLVGYSKPYTFGRLNNDVIVLLSSLGITNDKVLAKQQEYFEWITNASKDPVKAVDFLFAIGENELAERVLLDGLDHPAVSAQIRRRQLSETARFRNEKGRSKAPIFIGDSRRLFGVCDPYQVLKEGEVHIRIMTARKGPSTPIHGDVIVVRNPCLHPGDCLKLRAVHHNKLAHLVDCIVFASVARPGHHSAPSMSSGGDLDGDEYFVCWDKDLVPSKVAESYDYPGNKEFTSKKIERSDLANHFASYSGAGVARVSSLHAKWVRASPSGALSAECQELNALHSQCVDGARIRIPDRLTNPPDRPDLEPYILDLLEADRTKFADEFTKEVSLREAMTSTDIKEGKELLVALLQSQQSAVSEYELFTLACLVARKHDFDVTPFLSHLDVSALSAQEKHALSATLRLSPEKHPYVWNSLIRSDILTPRDLFQRALNHPFSMQRLYSSKVHGLTTFFEYLQMATQEYTRKLLILKTEERFAIGIFMRGEIPWDEDPDVNENVVVCSFMPNTASTLSGHIGDTFIFLNRAPRASDSEIAASIALGKISATVQRQIGRIRSTPVIAIELHVVSNRDRVAHQLFDLWFEHVPTEELLPRFQRRATPYQFNDLRDVDWKDPENRLLLPSFFPKASSVFPRVDSPSNAAFGPPPGSIPDDPKYEHHTQESMNAHLSKKVAPEINKIMEFALEHHAEEEMFLIFNFTVAQTPLDCATVKRWMEMFPPLAFTLLKSFPPKEDGSLAEEIADTAHDICRNIIRCANSLGIAVLVALEKISRAIATMDVEQYFDLLTLTALSVRSRHLVQEILLVLNDCRINAAIGPLSPSMKYGCKFALSIAFDRAEEAADECPCDDSGKPGRQRTPPTQAKLSFIPDDPAHIRAVVRVDARTDVRLHSHVRLQATSKATNRWTEALVLDGLVVVAMKGELKISLLHPPPPEMERMDWNMYNAGIIATSRAMMDAVLRLLKEGAACCKFHKIITGELEENDDLGEEPAISNLGHSTASARLNESQVMAVNSCTAPLSLIWGPPGTGKTTVVVDILRDIIKKSSGGDLPKILMTASTHNAVDNVLERFVAINGKEELLPEQQILRVATDQSKVNEDLKHYTVDARVGGDTNENNRLAKKAQERVKAAVLVFTTCAGAGLGTLRKVDFDIAIIDEASQITEPGSLIPLVKGIKRAVLVGDHVQLRPTVGKMGAVLEFDISLLERLYTHVEKPQMRKTMLDVQYRSPKELMAFPSKAFYDGKLKTGLQDTVNILRILSFSSFPWPRRAGALIPTVFIQCSDEEDTGGMSKRNIGQVDLVGHILPMLTTPEGGDVTVSPNDTSSLASLKITVLTPYKKQIQALCDKLPSSVPCSTVDAFQGRESDIIIFSTVRCNTQGDIGFLDDRRRLNVMWTRARLALIIIGDRQTLGANPLWKEALDSCTEVKVTLPESSDVS